MFTGLNFRHPRRGRGLGTAKGHPTTNRNDGPGHFLAEETLLFFNIPRPEGRVNPDGWLAHLHFWNGLRPGAESAEKYSIEDGVKRGGLKLAR
jgi:hypothetical protein